MTTIEKLAYCIETGKIDLACPYPPDMKGEPGAYELTRQALDEGLTPQEILDNAMISAMEIVGKKFTENKIYIPQMLMSAKAMTRGLEHLKPFFQDGSVERKGTLIIGTVAGDLHDLGKNLVAMMIEGNGWNIIDLGVDASTDKFLEQMNNHPGASIGLSALLTSTMVNMEKTVTDIKKQNPEAKILVGGAPLSQNFCEQIGADFYSPDPQGAVNYLNNLKA